MVARTVQRASVVATDAVLIGSWADPGRHVATGQASYFGSGAKPEWPKPGPKGRDRGWCLGEGLDVRCPPAMGYGGALLVPPVGSR